MTAALASHCRRAPAMGLLDQAAFLDIVAGQGKRPPPMPRAQVHVRQSQRGTLACAPQH